MCSDYEHPAVLATLRSLGVRFGVLDHAVNVFLGQAQAFLDSDRLLLAGALVLAVTCTMPLASKVASDLRKSPAAPAGCQSSGPRQPYLCWRSHAPPDRPGSTDGWLSSAVVKSPTAWVGIVVFALDKAWSSPPLGLDTRNSGVTSSSRTFHLALRTPACRAAPTATTSSGTPLLGSLPPVGSRSVGHRGHRVQTTTKLRDRSPLPKYRCQRSPTGTARGQQVLSDR